MGIAKNRAERIGSTVVQIGSTKLVPNADNDIEVKDTSNVRKKVIAAELRVGTGNDIVIIKRDSSTGKAKFETSSDGGGSSTEQSIGGSAIYTNPSDLPVSGNSAGDMAFVTSTNNLMIHNGSGWYKVATVTNASPTISSAGNASYTFAQDGTPVSIEITASDPEGVALQYKYVVSSGSIGSTAAVTSSATSGGTYSALNVNTLTTNKYFKVTPSTTEAHAGTFSLTFSAYDGVNTATSSASSFTLSFSVNASYYFDGSSGDELSIADSNDWYLGTGDFTIEAWIYAKTLSGSGAILAQWPDNGATANNSWVLETVGTELDFYTAHGGTTLTSHTGSITLSTNKWYHVAVQRSSGTIKSYINGVEDFSVSNSNDFNNPASPLTIGGGVASSAGATWDGYISNARIVKGSIAYTPATVTSASSASSSYGMVSTPNTLPTWGTTWTLETWVYITNSASYNTFFSGPGGFYIAKRSSKMETYGVGGFTDSPGSGTVNLNQWHHYAASNNGGSIKIFLDGNQIASGTSNSAIVSGQLHMMSQGGNSWPTFGYMADTRLVIGTAVYSGNFTPPSNQLTKTGGTYPSTTNVNTSIPAAHTYLLTNQTTSGTTIADNSDQNYTLTTAGALAGSTTSPYSPYITAPSSGLTAVTNTKLLALTESDPVYTTNGSYLFNAEDENLLINHADMALGSGDWTIDWWFQIIGTPSSNNWFFSLGTENADGIQCYYLESGNTLNFWDPGGNGSMRFALTNHGSETGEWYHVRFCRNGNNHYVFINGNCIGGSASNGSIITTGQSWSRSYTHAPSSNNCRIGTQWSTGYGWEDGLLMSDFRIIKGTSLQTSATGFARPTTPSTAVSGTVLLTCQNSTGNATVDNSGTSKTISIAQGTVTPDSRKVPGVSADQSTSSHTITKTGDILHSYVTPFVQTQGGSTYFAGYTGSSNNGYTYVDSPVDSAVEPGNGDFTIEYWIQSKDISAGTQMPFDYNYSTANGIMMYINTSGRLVANQGSSILLLNDGTGSAPLMVSNTWYHVALCRNSGQLRMYQNGILCTNTAGYGSEDGSHPFTSNLTQDRITIGVKYFGGHDTFAVNGYISNFRLVVGTAVYTGDSSFSPPTSALTAISNTQLLTCQNSTGTITDASSNNFTLVVGSGAENGPIATRLTPF